MPNNPYEGSLNTDENILEWWKFEVQVSYEYAFGRKPSDYELNYWEQWRRKNMHDNAERYTLVHWNMNWLRSEAGANELPAMITRTYEAVMKRLPRAVSDIPGMSELDYWKQEVLNHVPEGENDKERGRHESHTFAWICVYHQRWLDAGHQP